MTEAFDRLAAALSDHYRIERELGEGGMAMVYLAEDIKHGRQVALKVLKPDLAAVVGGERFIAEIRTTANLQHPNILPLFDSGEADGFLYYVMPYVEGESLRDRLDREKQLPVEESVRIVGELAEALDHAHRQGVVHRDIKPANILMRDGRPLLADFGIALAVGTAGGSRLTETGLSMGTPYYMSPEQAVGDQPITAASDTYALGCVLYEMLVGEPPHQGGSAQAVLARIITGSFEPPRRSRPAIPANVDGAVQCSLERVPADRFPSMSAFAAALRNEAFRYGEVESDTGRSVHTLRGLLVAFAIAGVAGLLAGVLLADVFRGGSRREGSALTNRPVQITFDGRSGVPAISADGQFVAYGISECQLGSWVECPADLMVQEVGTSQAVRLVDDAWYLRNLRWSFDGRGVYFSADLADGRMGIFRMPRLGGAAEAISNGWAFDSHPSGDTLLVISDSDDGETRVALILDPSDWEPVAEFPIDGEIIVDVHWSQDGTRFVVDDGVAARIYSRTGQLLGSRSTHSRGLVRWTPDDRGVLFVRPGPGREDDLVRMEVAADGSPGETTVVQAGVPTLYLGHFDVARRTGDFILQTGDARTDGWAFPMDNLDEGEQLPSGTTWYGAPMAYDSTTVYYMRGDALGDNLYRYDLESREELALTSHALPGGFFVRRSWDGARMMFGLLEEGVMLAGELDVRSTRFSTERTASPYSQFHPVGADGFLYETDLGIDLAFMEGDSVRTVAESDLGVFSAIALSPDEESVLYLALLDDGDLALRIAPLDGSAEPETLFELGDAVEPGVLWTREGVFMARGAEDGSLETHLWRFDIAERRLEPVGPLSVSCDPSSVHIDPDARVVVCQINDYRSDVRVYRGLVDGG